MFDIQISNITSRLYGQAFISDLCIHSLSDLGSRSRVDRHYPAADYPPPTEWTNKMAAVNSLFASVSESEILELQNSLQCNPRKKNCWIFRLAAFVTKSNKKTKKQRDLKIAILPWKPRSYVRIVIPVYQTRAIWSARARIISFSSSKVCNELARTPTKLISDTGLTSRRKIPIIRPPPPPPSLPENKPSRK